MRGRFKTLTTLALGTAFIATLATLLFPAQQAAAAYDGGRLIDDSIFLNSRAMSEWDIQNFLNNKGGGIANRTFTLNCYGQDSKERQWYSTAGAPCDQNVRASTIIYYAAQVYGINPQAILATLQKEQSLITAPNPTDWQINQAMGYACPTTGQCAGNSSFFYQIDSGVWVLRYHYERARGNMDWWSPSTTWTCGSEKQFYKPNLKPGQNVSFYDEDNVMYRTLYIHSAATSSLYCYTPHTYNNPNGLYGLPATGTTGRYYSGSYNFVRYFELWFGPAQQPSYSWYIHEQNVYTDPQMTKGANLASVQAGDRLYVRIRAINTGTATWTNYTANAVHIGTLNPQDRSSIFCSDEWLDCARPGGLRETFVSPGGAGTFEFSIKVSNNVAPRQYIETFNAVAEGITWFNGATNISFSVAPTYSTYSVSSTAHTDSTRSTGVDISKLLPGQQAYMTVYATNNGNVTWTNNGSNPVRLGAWNPRDKSSPICASGWLDCARPATLKEASVAPGQTGTFEFPIKAPDTAGRYTQGLNILSEGRSWGANTVTYDLNLTSNQPVYSWSFAGQEAYQDSAMTQAMANPYTLSLSRGQTAYLRIKATNTGNVTWSKTGSNPVRVGAWWPSDRTSPFCASTWIDCARPASMKENTVAPGQTATFEFAVKAPNTTGSYSELYNLVSEGKSWHSGAAVGYRIDVKL